MGRLALPSVLRAMDERRDNLNSTLKEIGRERAEVEQELGKTSGEVRNIEAELEQASNRAAEAPLSRQRMPLHELALARQLRRHGLRQA
jgi:F0F1-type ATP synthase membrane subunit b/b'